MTSKLNRIERSISVLLARNEALRTHAEVEIDAAVRLELERSAHELETEASVLRHSGFA